jgi:uncharacterized protein YbcI
MMTGTKTDPHGSQSLTAQISTEVVHTLKESFGKGPVRAKSYLLDDFLLVVMRGGMTVAEETMLERGRSDQVRQFRQAYQDEMRDVFVPKIEALTGRRIVNYQSQVLFDPHIVLEIFFFDDAVADGAAGLLGGAAAATVGTRSVGSSMTRRV